MSMKSPRTLFENLIESVRLPYTASEHIVSRVFQMVNILPSGAQIINHVYRKATMTNPLTTRREPTGVSLELHLLRSHSSPERTG